MKCPFFKLKDVVFYSNEIELNSIDINSSYSFVIKAVFVEDGIEQEILIPNENIKKLKFEGFNNLITSNDNKIIKSGSAKIIYPGLVTISFDFKNKTYVFQKQMILEGRLYGNLSGTIICSKDGENTEEIDFSKKFVIKGLDGDIDEIYERDIEENVNIDLNDSFFIGIKNLKADHKISILFPLSIDFVSENENEQFSYSLSLEKFSDDLAIPIDIGVMLKAKKITKLNFNIKFKGADVYNEY